MPAETHIKIASDQWEKITDIFYKKSGLWLTLTSIFRKGSDGTWKQVFQRVDEFDPVINFELLSSNRTGPGDRIQTGDSLKFGVSVSSNGRNEANRVGFVRFLTRYKHLNPAVSESKWSPWRGKKVVNSSPYNWENIVSNGDREASANRYGKRVRYQVKPQVVTKKDDTVFKETNPIEFVVDDQNRKPTLGFSIASNEIFEGQSVDFTVSISDDFGVDTVKIRANYTPDEDNLYQNVFAPFDMGQKRNPDDLNVSSVENSEGVFEYKAIATDVKGRERESTVRSVDVKANDSPNIANEKPQQVTSRWSVVEGSINYRTIFFEDSSGINESDVSVTSSPDYVSVDQKTQVSSERVDLKLKFAPTQPRPESVVTIEATDTEGNKKTINITTHAFSDNNPPVLDAWGSNSVINRSFKLAYPTNYTETFSYSTDDDESWSDDQFSSSADNIPDSDYDLIPNPSNNEFDLEISSYSSSKLDEGKYDINIILTDQYGEETSKTVKYDIQHEDFQASFYKQDWVYPYGVNTVDVSTDSNVIHMEIMEEDTWNLTLRGYFTHPKGISNINNITGTLRFGYTEDLEELRDEEMITVGAQGTETLDDGDQPTKYREITFNPPQDNSPYNDELDDIIENYEDDDYEVNYERRIVLPFAWIVDGYSFNKNIAIDFS